MIGQPDDLRVTKLEASDGRPVVKLPDVVGSSSETTRVHPEKVFGERLEVGARVARLERAPDLTLQLNQLIDLYHSAILPNLAKSTHARATDRTCRMRASPAANLGSSSLHVDEPLRRSSTRRMGGLRSER